MNFWMNIFVLCCTSFIRMRDHACQHKITVFFIINILDVKPRYCLGKFYLLITWFWPISVGENFHAHALKFILKNNEQAYNYLRTA